MSDILKICAISLLSAIVGAVVGGISGSISRAVRLAGLALVLGGVVGILGQVMSELSGIGSGFNADKYISVLVKGLAISTLCRVCCDVCRDCGESTLAGAVESAGKLSLVLLALPIVSEICQSAKEILGSI